MAESRRTSKHYWHPLSLQQLSPGHFSRVVNQILSERLTLIPSTPRRHDAKADSAALQRS